MLEIIDIVNKLPSSGSNGYRTLRNVRGLVVHNSGVDKTGNDIERYRGYANYHIRKGYSRLAYHLMISPEGKVYLTNRFQEICYHAGNFKVNLSSIAVCLDGNLTKHKPTDAQLMALKELFVYLTTRRPDLPYLVGNTVKTHREVRIQRTSCPGNHVQQFVDALKNSSCKPLL